MRNTETEYTLLHTSSVTAKWRSTNQLEAEADYVILADYPLGNQIFKMDCNDYRRPGGERYGFGGNFFIAFRTAFSIGL